MKSRDGCVEVRRREFALGGLVLAGLLAARGAAIAADPGAAETAGPAAADVLANLMKGNRRFRDGRPRVRALTARRSALAAGQRPHVVVLACSDAEEGRERQQSQ